MLRWIAPAAFFAASSAFAQIAPAPAPDPTQIDAAMMKHTLGEFWGGVVVGHNGKVVYARGFGVANESLDPITPDSLFDIGSISKQFTAAAILRLEMDGKLTTTDPVSRFFPNLTDQARDRAGIVTLHNLLTHTSGMTDARAIQRLDFPDRDEAVRLALAAAPGGPPGERFEYCNAGYIVLAAVVEVASGAPFEDYVRDRIFKPAGLSSTGFLDGINLDEKRATVRSMRARSSGRPLRAPLFTSPIGEPWAWGLKGAGGVITSMNDLVRWDAALRDDLVLNGAARTKLFTPASQSYALGWQVDTLPDGSLKVHHGGATRGFRAQLTRYIDRGIVIAVISNESADVLGVEAAIAKVAARLPASLVLELRTATLPMNKHRAAEIADGLSCAVSSDATNVILSVNQGATTVATARLARATVPALLADLARVLPRRDAAPADAGALISTLAYQPNPEGIIRLEGDLKWNIMKEYSGFNPETGQRTVDRRTTLVIIDESKGFWPLILKLNPAAGADLAAALESFSR